MVINEAGLPDLERSYCEEIEKYSCTGSALEYAKTCIEQESSCDPCMYKDTYICDNLAFPGICEFGQ